MPDVNMRNTVGAKTTSNQTKTFKNKSNYFRGLMNTWAFSQSLKDFTIGFKIIILLARLLTFIFYTLFYIVKSIVLFIIGFCQINKVIK